MQQLKNVILHVLGSLKTLKHKNVRRFRNYSINSAWASEQLFNGISKDSRLNFCCRLVTFFETSVEKNEKKRFSKHEKGKIRILERSFCISFKSGKTTITVGGRTSPTQPGRLRTISNRCRTHHVVEPRRRLRPVPSSNWVIIILYYAIYGSTQAHKYKKAKIHLKYDLKYKKDMNTNIKAHSSARWATPHATQPTGNWSALN